MWLITEGQQQQQLIVQEQRAWRDELVNERRAQKESQELCEARIQKWQEEFAQMQLQQHQQIMAEHRDLLQAHAKKQLSQHEHLVQCLGQLEQRQGEEEHAAIPLKASRANPRKRGGSVT